MRDLHGRTALDGEVVAGSLSLDEWRWWIFTADEKKRSNSKYIDEDAEYVVCVFIFENIQVDLCERMVCEDCMILLKVELKAAAAAAADDDDDDDKYTPT